MRACAVDWAVDRVSRGPGGRGRAVDAELVGGDRRDFPAGERGPAIGAVVAVQFSSSLDHKLAGQSFTSRGRAAIAQAKQLTFGRPPVAGLPPHQAAAITAASGQSSLEAFRVGIGIASGLVILGGLIGAAGLYASEAA